MVYKTIAKLVLLAGVMNPCTASESESVTRDRAKDIQRSESVVRKSDDLSRLQKEGVTELAIREQDQTKSHVQSSATDSPKSPRSRLKVPAHPAPAPPLRSSASSVSKGSESPSLSERSHSQRFASPHKTPTEQLKPVKPLREQKQGSSGKSTMSASSAGDEADLQNLLGGRFVRVPHPSEMSVEELDNKTTEMFDQDELDELKRLMQQNADEVTLETTSVKSVETVALSRNVASRSLASRSSTSRSSLSDSTKLRIVLRGRADGQSAADPVDLEPSAAVTVVAAETADKRDDSVTGEKTSKKAEQQERISKKPLRRSKSVETLNVLQMPPECISRDSVYATGVVVQVERFEPLYDETQKPLSLSVRSRTQTNVVLRSAESSPPQSAEATPEFQRRSPKTSTLGRSFAAFGKKLRSPRSKSPKPTERVADISGPLPPKAALMSTGEDEKKSPRVEESPIRERRRELRKTVAQMAENDCFEELYQRWARERGVTEHERTFGQRDFSDFIVHVAEQVAQSSVLGEDPEQDAQWVEESFFQWLDKKHLKHL